MPYNLKGRNVLVVAGSRGLGAHIVAKFAAEGANVAINFASSRERAEGVAREAEEKHGVRTVLVQGDAGVIKECERIVAEAKEALGGLDVVVQNAGWTKMVPFGDLHAMTEEEWDLSWAVNVKGHMAVLRAAKPIFDANPDGGAFISTGSIAGTSAGGSSLPYSVTKAAQVHLIKVMASSQGPKIRINAVLPGLLMTEWAQRFSDEQIKGATERAVLKKPTDLEDCAEMFVSIAKNSSMTGQMVTVDSGLNVMGR